MFRRSGRKTGSCWRRVTALDVAGGSGYGAAILAALGAEVTILEAEEGAVASARTLTPSGATIDFVVGDLAAGVAGRSFDVILVNGAFEEIPDKLLSQLRDDGRLVGVDASFRSPKAVLIEKVGGVASRRILFDAAAPKLEAFRRAPSFAF
jgi:protein-L-isoaspartate(D-aspartate) O-methyltransferase